MNAKYQRPKAITWRDHNQNHHSPPQTPQTRHQSISFGLILLYHNEADGNWYTIMNERNHSYAFSEFLRGKFSFQENCFSNRSRTTTYIKTLLERMTNQEKLMIKEAIESNNDIREPSASLHFNKTQFEQNLYKLRSFRSVQSILDNQNFTFPYCEIGFPKGKRTKREAFLDCAKRECEEETGISPSEYTLVPNCTIEEVYISTNNIRYKNVYFVATFNDAPKQPFRLGPIQLRETKTVLLVNINEAANEPFTRNYESYRKSTINTIIKEIIPQLKLQASRSKRPLPLASS